MTRSITIEDLYRFKFVSRPRLSPDGGRVAFVVTTIDGRAHAYRSTIWVMPTEGGAAARLVGGPYNAQSPAWSPDGRWLAFVSDREGESGGHKGWDKQGGERVGRPQGSPLPSRPNPGKGKSQIWILPTDGGEARQLTFMPHGANNPTWSPDSSCLLFTAQVGPLDEKFHDESGTHDGKPLPKARVIDRSFYRLDGTGFIYERRQHLFLADMKGSEPRQLTDGDWDDKDAAWSPDGRHIAFTSSRGEDRWHLPCADLYTLAINICRSSGRASWVEDQVLPEQPLRLTDGTRNCVSPSWSPDGQSIAFLAARKYRSGGQVELFTIVVDGAARAGTSHSPYTLCNLTEDFEGSCADWTNSDMTNEQLRPPPAWSADGRTLYVLAVQRGATRVYAVSSNGAGTQPPVVTPGNIHALDFSMDAARQQMAVLIETPLHIAEIFMMSMDAPRPGQPHQPGQPQGIAPTIYDVGQPDQPHSTRATARDCPYHIRCRPTRSTALTRATARDCPYHIRCRPTRSTAPNQGNRKGLPLPYTMSANQINRPHQGNRKGLPLPYTMTAFYAV